MLFKKKGNENSYTCDGITPSTSIDWGLPVCKAALRRRLVSSSGQLVDHESAKCPSEKESQQHSRLRWKESVGQGRSFFPPLLTWFAGFHM